MPNTDKDNKLLEKLLGSRHAVTSSSDLLLAYLEAANSGNSSKEYNVICVDWSTLSREFLYVNSVMYAEKVGRRVGEFIVFLKLGGFIDNYKQVHIIGKFYIKHPAPPKDIMTLKLHEWFAQKS